MILQYSDSEKEEKEELDSLVYSVQRVRRQFSRAADSARL